MKGIRVTIAMAIIASFVLPASAVAVMLDLSDNNTTFAGSFTSGSMFSDPAGLGWDLTITSSGGDLNTNADGMGVGGLSGLDSGESIVFDFSPSALLEGFTIKNGANDSVWYVAVGSPTVISSETLPNAGAGGGDYFIGFASEADSLTILNTGSGAGSAYRIASLSFADAAVSEPAIIGLMGLGLFGMGAVKRIKKAA